MQKRYGLACGVAGAAAVLLTALRLFGGGVYTAGLCLAVLLFAAVVLLIGAKPRPLLVVAGGAAKTLGIFTAITGVAILAFSASEARDLLGGVYPYPQPVTVTVLSSIIVWATVLGGIGGGVVLYLVGVQWIKSGRTDRGRFGVAALLPVVWLWGRLVWYMTSFASAVNRFSSLSESVLLLLEMLFLLLFARYISGVEEKAPRFAVPLSLCTAMVGLSVWATRAVAVLTKDTELYAATVLTVFPDMAISGVAFVFAFVQMFGDGAEENEAAEAFDDEDDDPRFVLNEDDLTVTDDEEENDGAAEEHRPMGLEDIINEFLSEKEEKN